MGEIEGDILKARQRVDRLSDPATSQSSSLAAIATSDSFQALTRSYVPRLSARLVTRTRLLERIEQATSTPLTVVLAPAGFGKTTLMANWARQTRRCVAWVSADEHEGTIVDLFTRISHTIADVLGHKPDSWLNAPIAARTDESPDPRQIANALIERLSKVKIQTSVIIDDYHLIKDRNIHIGLVELVEGLPESVNIILATRTVPPLPLTRMRARGLLRQIDADQMRFAELESAEFLRTTMGLNLSEEQVNRLTTLMEGWIVGLQLAAIDIQEGANFDEVVESTRRPERHALAFLLEEVLQRQPNEIQDFLLKTSILERMSAPLCDYVTKSTASEQILAKLQSENLFIVTLDDSNKWVRYHHLFRFLLREQLDEKFPVEITELNKRASKWHADNKLLPEAVAYSLAASDWMTMADMMQRVGAPHLLETKAFRDWLRSLPRDAFIAQPKLSSWMAWTSIAAGDVKGFNRVLEMCGDNLTSNVAEFAMMKAIIACLTLDGATSLFYARKALDLTQGNPVYRALALSTIGVAQRILGKPIAAQAAFIEACEIARQTGPATMNILMRYETYVGHSQALQGRLDQALETINKVEEKADAAGVTVPPTVPLYRSRIYYARDQLSQAHVELTRALEITRKTGVEMNTPLLWLTIAMNHAGLGDITRALTTLDELKVWLRRNGNSGYTRSADTLRHQLLLRQGHIDDVGYWLKTTSSLEPSEIVYTDHDRYVLYATWAYFESSVKRNSSYLRPAIKLLERLSEGAQADGRMVDLGRSQVALALLNFELKDLDSVRAHLNTASSSLLPGGLVRSFLEHKERLRMILEALPNTGARLPWLDQLGELLGLEDSPSTVPKIEGHLLVISDREKEVLDLVALGLTNQEIADSLCVSMNTVKTHVKNLYFKLDSHTRTQAVAAARTAGLV